jgi:hypothetical protein
MVLRTALLSVGLMLAAGLALWAGEPGRFSEPDSDALQLETSGPFPGETHPVLERQREVPRRTALINDVDSQATQPKQQTIDWGVPVKVSEPAQTSSRTIRTAPASRENRYQIIPTSDGTLLLDAQSGRTWRLEAWGDEKPVWKKIDRDSD